MQVSGVRSSWETLATNSLRTRSSRRSSVTSWSTRRTPAAPGPRPSGAPRAATTRFDGRTQLELVAGRRARLPGPRPPGRAAPSGGSTSRNERPSPGSLTPNIERAPGLSRRTRPRSSSATTPSIMPSRMVAHLRLLVGQALDLLAERHGHPVERHAQRRDLVVARHRNRLREVALGHAPGGGLHLAHGPRHPPAHEEPDHHGHRDGQERPGHDRRRGPAPARRRRPGSGARAGAPRAGPTGSLERHRDVEEVPLDRRAPAHGAADCRPPGPAGPPGARRGSRSRGRTRGRTPPGPSRPPRSR